MVFSLYESIYEAFLVKSFGMADDLGYKWPELKDRTKAYHKPSLRRQLYLPNVSKHRPTLTEAQNNSWKRVYTNVLRRLNAKTPGNLPPLLQLVRKRTREAERVLASVNALNKAEAAKIAWNRVKNELGATTLLELTKSLDARINYETGRLAASLEPTSPTAPYQPGPEQKYERQGPRILIGSLVPYAKYYRYGRRLWAEDITPWKNKAYKAGQKAVANHLLELL